MYEESEAIKSFNIGEEIMKVVTGVKDFVVDTFNHVVASIKAFDPMAALGDLGNMGKDFISALLRGVLPPPNVLTFDAPEVSIFGKKFGGGSINLNPIPDSVYKFAGLDDKTGDRIITNAGAGASAKAGLIENRAVDDTNTAKAAAIAASNVSVPSRSSRSSLSRSAPWDRNRICDCDCDCDCAVLGGAISPQLRVGSESGFA